MTDIERYMIGVGRAAREASRVIAAAPSAVKSRALLAIAEALDDRRGGWLKEANARDMEAARAQRASTSP